MVTGPESQQRGAEQAVAELQGILLRATLYMFHHNRRDLLALARDDILQLAEDCAQEALIAIMNHLSEFRGDSKFTTWAYKFAINFARTSHAPLHWINLPCRRRCAKLSSR